MNGRVIVALGLLLFLNLLVACGENTSTTPSLATNNPTPNASKVALVEDGTSKLPATNSPFAGPTFPPTTTPFADTQIPATITHFAVTPTGKPFVATPTPSITSLPATITYFAVSPTGKPFVVTPVPPTKATPGVLYIIDELEMGKVKELVYIFIDGEFQITFVFDKVGPLASELYISKPGKHRIKLISNTTFVDESGQERDRSGYGEFDLNIQPGQSFKIVDDLSVNPIQLSLEEVIPSPFK